MRDTWLRCALCLAFAASCRERDNAEQSQTAAAVGGSIAGNSSAGTTAASGGQTSPSAGRGAQAPRAGVSAAGKGANSPRAGAAAGGAGNTARDAAVEDGGPMTPPPSDAGKSDTSTPELPGWKLVWNDEFSGAMGAKLDASKWVYETGGTGWGNNQQEFDTDRADNASLDGNGELNIVARKESYMGKSYTSVRLKTQGKFEHQYGRYEIRMRIPFGQGIWPAFWMLGVDPSNAGWPTRGEIDIMENIGREPDTIHGTLHGPGYSGGNGVGAPSKLASGKRFADDYHVYAIEWEKDVIRWYVDDKLYQTRKPSDLPNGSKWVYDHPFFLLLNLAVGGEWPGYPDMTTMFPQTMKVDYVRVYDRADSGMAKP